MLADFPDLRAQVFQERYAISELICASSHRATFAGTTVDGTHPIVLLLLRPSLPHDSATRARFDHRVRASSRVKHPAIAVPIDSGETLDGKLWLVFERPDGEPLDRALASRPAGRLRWAEARPLLLDLVRGLAAAHARGVVHGSVSPASCWVHGLEAGAPGLRLLALGANFDPAEGEPAPSYSRTTRIGGDPMYMAPETAGGLLGDVHSDAYLVGLVAWVMLVGQPPFTAANPFQLVSMHLQVPVPTMREAGVEVSPMVEAWVCALLAKQPQQRPASMTEVEQGLLAVDELGQPRAVRAEELEPPRGRRRRAKAPTARDEAVLRLGEREPAPVHGLGRRLPGQEIVDPRAAIVPSLQVSPLPSWPSESAAELAPPTAPGVPPTAATVTPVDAFERTIALGSIERIAPAQPATPASKQPTGTVVLSHAEPHAGPLPDATPRLGNAAATSELPDAPLMRRGTEVASVGQGATEVLGIEALGFEPREPVPAQRELQTAPASWSIAPMTAPSPQASAPYPPATRATDQRASAAAQPPVRSWLALWIVLVTLVAAAAGLAVGLLLGGG